MKQRGLEGLGGFISISKELRALWTPEFASRLWCIFELAAFRKINPTGDIVIAPVSIEVFVAMLMPAATASSILYMFMLAARQTVLVGALVSSVAVFPCGYGVHLLRRDMQCKKDMLTVLENFDLDAATSTVFFSKFSSCFVLERFLGSSTATGRQHIDILKVGC